MEQPAVNGLQAGVSQCRTPVRLSDYELCVNKQVGAGCQRGSELRPNLTDRSSRRRSQSTPAVVLSQVQAGYRKFV